MLVIVAVLASCSTTSPEAGTSTTQGNQTKPTDAGVTVSLPAPRSIEAEADQTQLVVSFEPVEGAESYLIELGGTGTESRSIPVEVADCDAQCSITMDAATVGGASTAAVRAMSGSGRSDPSETIDLPRVDIPAPVGNQTVNSIVVTRHVDGRLVVETVASDPGSIEERLSTTMAEPDVASAGVELIGTWAETGAEPPTEGLGRWYLNAFDSGTLPESAGEGVVVAVIDSGVDLNHPVFSDAAIDHVGEQVVQSHGTGVASLIAGDPGSRVPGIAPNAEVRVYDVFDGAETFTAGDLARTIIQAVDDGAQVINLSLSAQCNNVGPVSFSCPQGLAAAIDHAEQNGVVVVASAGNDGDGAAWCEGGLNPLDFQPNADHWPAKYPSVIAVGGIDRNGDQWACSPDKEYIDVLAPAEALLVAAPNGGYRIGSGTSYAAPLVAGLAAVILAERPDLTPSEVGDLLRRATDDRGRLIPGMVVVMLGLSGADGEVDDWLTGARVVPFRATVEYLSGHPARVHAEANNHFRFNTNIRSIDTFVRVGDAESVGVEANGALFLLDDGTVTGYGQLRQPRALNGYGSGVVGSGIEWFQFTQGFGASCPWSYRHKHSERIKPTFEWGWTIPVRIEGRVVEGSGGPSLEIELSFGEEGDQPSEWELPEVEIYRDDLDSCPGELPDGHHDNGRYAEVLAQRDEAFEVSETYLELVVDHSGLRAQVPLKPTRQATIEDNVRVTLAVLDAAYG